MFAAINGRFSANQSICVCHTLQTTLIGKRKMYEMPNCINIQMVNFSSFGTQ